MAASATIDLVAHQIRGHLKTQRWYHKFCAGQRRQLHMVLQDPLFHQRIWKSSHFAQTCRTDDCRTDDGRTDGATQGCGNINILYANETDTCIRALLCTGATQVLSKVRLEECWSPCKARSILSALPISRQVGWCTPCVLSRLSVAEIQSWPAAHHGTAFDLFLLLRGCRFLGFKYTLVRSYPLLAHPHPS